MTDRVGQQIGHYRLVRCLGEGGFATVYLGQHLYLNTQVAIKILSTSLSKDESEQFQQEARFIAHLKHPHIIRILDFGLHEQTTLFLVMEYATGGTLRHRHPQGSRLPLSQVVSYVKQVAEALQYAHNHRLIHRDIKPENMLINEHQEILLSDFGIALISQSSRMENAQEVIGTTYYMAPEQFRGRPRLASDQYALGIVTYEWLSGVRPFQGNFTEVACQHLFKEPAPLSQRVSGLPLSVERVVFKALAKDPEQRFANVREFAQALEASANQPEVDASLERTLPSKGDPTPADTAEQTLPSKGSPPSAGTATLPIATIASTPVPSPRSGRKKGLLVASLIVFVCLIIGGPLIAYTTTGEVSIFPQLARQASTKTTTKSPIDPTRTSIVHIVIQDGENPVVMGCNADATSPVALIHFSFSGGISGTASLMHSNRCQAAWAQVVFDQPVPGDHGGATLTRDSDGETLTCNQGGDRTVGPGGRTCYTGMFQDGPGHPNHAHAYFIYLDGHAEVSKETASY